MKRLFTKGIAFSMATAVALSGMIISPKNVEEVKAEAQYNLIWSDEFDGTSLNKNNWNIEVNGNGGGNNELQYYTDRESNIKVSDGTLKLIGRKENYGGKSYTSGRITTQGKKSFKYGKIEARLKIPSFSGAWPAFWTLGESIKSEGWPRCGEIDIMEAINTENRTYGYIHWNVESSDYNGQGDTGGSSANRLPQGYKRTEWHTYGIIWDEKKIQWYIDDQVFRTAAITEDHMREFRKDHFIILNLAIGGTWPGYNIDDSAFPDKTVYEIDYVRVYQKEEVEYTGPMITVTEDAVETGTSTWTSYYDTANQWAYSSGTASLNGTTLAEGVTLDVTARGVGDQWGVQAGLPDLNAYAGATYDYKCTLLSDKDKVVYVKVADETDGELSGEFVSLKAGVPYEYTKKVTLDTDYEGTIKLAFGAGACPGDTLGQNDGFVLKIYDVSLKTTASIPDPNYKPENPTTKPSVTQPQTTTATTATVTKPAKSKIKKVYTKKKASKKIKIKIKKITGAKGYQVQVSKSKSFKKKNLLMNKKSFGKTTKTFKSSKFKNKKKLYIRVRAYVVKADGTKLCGKWSKMKKVKVK